MGVIERNKLELHFSFILVIHANGDKVTKVLFENPQDKGPIRWMIKSPSLDDYVMF